MVTARALLGYVNNAASHRHVRNAWRGRGIVVDESVLNDLARARELIERAEKLVKHYGLGE